MRLTILLLAALLVVTILLVFRDELHAFVEEDRLAKRRWSS